MSTSDKGIAIFDLDRTITIKRTFTPYLVHVAMKRPLAFLWAPVIAMMMIYYKLGGMSRTRLKEHMLSMTVGGRHKDTVAYCSDMFAMGLMNGGIRPGALRQIEKHKQAGDTLVLATASMDFYAGEIAKKLGFDVLIGTRSTWDDDGRIIPKIRGENCYGPNKLVMVKEVFAEKGLDSEKRVTYAYTDHHTDLPLLNWVDHPVAVNPSKKLRAAAEGANMKIEDWLV
ncbi:MAG: HAD-IB family hydrolase [Sphingomonadales bacterium]|nr:HAD-IB family hydrolase [Sphingomonadales bacterium]